MSPLGQVAATPWFIGSNFLVGNLEVHEPDGSPLTIEDIIGATGDSPLTYLQKLRIAAAKRLLESDHRSMQEISDAVGYQDVVFFRQLFQRHTGVSPSAYRRRFGLNGDKAA